MQHPGDLTPAVAQGTRWQHPAIADATVIEDANAQIMVQRVMLQTIVTDDDIDLGVFGQQCPARIKPFCCNEDWHFAPTLNQQRLVPN